MQMDEAPTRLRCKPSWLINKVSTRAHRLIGETMAAAGGHAYHFAILAALDEFGPDSQAQIGQRCGIDQSDMHAMLNTLVEQGHVARTPDPADRRRNLITLTTAGRRRLQELDRTLTEVQHDILDALSATERETLTALLTRILDQIPAPDRPAAPSDLTPTTRER
ncbi:MarR family winged helix-turn-helix transcriptional regulator [Streptacidiphilus griseoplanus]|uniref:MarR family winged helix-turn-helix transcriptional regulator n=1 Tax=Peterkaempfera griseoplana TaxID=66896 RepID=UPI00099F0CA7|nr:MarR family winged helix-turn-helix transcriptional regulator [Peterkaempfera griseoplana]